jgi:hypothetical protein
MPSKPSPELQRAIERLQAFERLQQASQACQKAALEFDRPPEWPEAARKAIEELAARRTETGRLQNPDQADFADFVRSIVGTTVTDLAALHRDVRDQSRPVAERLQQLIEAIPTAATWSSQQLARTLGCSYSSVVRSPWWRNNRAGRGPARVGERRGRRITKSVAWE